MASNWQLSSHFRAVVVACRHNTTIIVTARNINEVFGANANERSSCLWYFSIDEPQITLHLLISGVQLVDPESAHPQIK